MENEDKKSAMSQLNQYIFVLGRERDICEAELLGVLKKFCFKFDLVSLTDSLLFINFLEDYPISSIVGLLGGTIKVYKICDSFELFRIENNLIEAGIREISSHFLVTQKTVDFGISFYFPNYSVQKINQFGFAIKQRLRKKGIASRFIALRTEPIISNAVTASSKLANKGIEFGVFKSGSICSFGILQGFSDLNEWSKRDYGKPAVDKYSGMLPPKLARMMVNLALSQDSWGLGVGSQGLGVGGWESGVGSRESGVNNHDQCLSNAPNSRSSLISIHTQALSLSNGSLRARPSESKTTPLAINSKLHTSNSTPPTSNIILIDPFCGSGNILLEGLLSGLDVIGCDISDRSANDSDRNIKWLREEYPSAKNKSFVAKYDATKVKFNDLVEGWSEQKKDIIIVTEPFLGKPKKLKASYKDIDEYEDVRTLYLSFLQNMLQFRDFSPTLCLVFPLVETLNGTRYSLLESSVDEIRKKGYTLIRTPLVYGRDYQIVKREIVLLGLQ